MSPCLTISLWPCTSSKSCLGPRLFSYCHFFSQLLCGLQTLSDSCFWNLRFWWFKGVSSVMIGLQTPLCVVVLVRVIRVSCTSKTTLKSQWFHSINVSSLLTSQLKTGLTALLHTMTQGFRLLLSFRFAILCGPLGVFSIV